MHKKVSNLISVQDIFQSSKSLILSQWVSYSSPQEILELHNIEEKYFIDTYANGVFDYFMCVISGKVEIGNCPIMQQLLVYLKDREISADELFEICSHFRRSMLDFSYDEGLNSKKLFDEISYIFDKNFKGILKFYTDTIFQKLIDARQEALKAGQAKDYFLSNMSHEIRTPLNAILGFVNILIDDDLSRKHRNYLDIIHNSGENLLSIINDILDFSKLRSGEFTIEPKIFSLHDELSHTMELFVASAVSKNITITSFIDPMIPKELFGDALRIKQILSNFISNAIKFTDVGGIISVEASCNNKVLNISVRDNGIGIAQEDIKNIFTAFAQAQYYGESNSRDGTGLGLSICHQLAEHMGGGVNVKSRVGEGSTFLMEIPVDIHTQECRISDDLSDMLILKIALYSKSKEISFQYEALLKYTTIFGMNTTIVDSIDGDYDIFVFVHEDIDYKLRNDIMYSKKKYLALMSKDYDDYDKYTHITSMCFPLYCSKIHNKFEDLLNENIDNTFKKRISNQFTGHILIAEDNEANQELIKIILSKYGLTFNLAKNGFEALELFKKNRYDLILMDEQMPVMNGNEAVIKILEYENKKGLSHTPVSALTANVIKGARERGLLNGFDSFLGKPVNIINSNNTTDNENQDVKIIGLDINKLRDELMLNDDEIIMLVNLFINKMKKSIPDLEDAIEILDYKKIQILAHGIKGSSANFRMENLQNMANELENMAKNHNTQYNYYYIFKNIKAIVEYIEVV